jgi:predicted metal-dependent hydrolase
MTLEVVIPKHGSVDPEKAITARLGWISGELGRLTTSRMVLTPEKVMYSGSYLSIVFTQTKEDAIIPEPAKGRVIVRASQPGRTTELVRRWFVKESSSYAVRKVADFAPVVGVRPSRVDVREIGKWGYCTRRGRLSFSWQLIALPDLLKEYVVWHELTHLRVFNHSIAFRDALSKVCPDFRNRERELDSIVPYARLPVG